jgi:hypothetical protein
MSLYEEQQVWIEAQLETVLATAARLLVRAHEVKAASILANAETSVTLWEDWDHQRTWRLQLAIPAEVYFEIEDRGAIEKAIDKAIAPVLEAISTSDFIETRITTALERDPDWRRKTRQFVSGESITNQGRVRSDNIAARKHDGLLFRSQPEVFFYEALKRTGVPFAPLSVVLRGGLEYRRVEPDFIIYYRGLTMIVEIDGDLYHTETPAAAHARLKLLTDEGARLERISASECDTPQKAQEAVQRVIATIERLRNV